MSWSLRRSAALALLVLVPLRPATAHADDDEDEKEEDILLSTERNNVPAMAVGGTMFAVGIGTMVLGGYQLVTHVQDPWSGGFVAGVAVGIHGAALFGVGLPLFVWGKKRKPIIDPAARPTSRVIIYREPIPQGYHAETRLSRGLLLGGGVLLTLAYVFEATLATADDRGRAGFIPLAGAFAASVAHRSTPESRVNAGSWDDVEREELVLQMAHSTLGVAQVAGFTMMAVGATASRVLVRDTPRTTGATGAPLVPSLTVGAGSAQAAWRF